MRSFLARHFWRQRSRILFSNSTELSRTRRYSASMRARSSSIRRSMLRQCSPRRNRGRCRPRFPVPLRPELALLAALDLYAPGLLYRGGTPHPHLEHTVLEPSADTALVRALRQRHAPPERPVAALPHVVAGSLLLLLGLAHATDGQNPVVERDVHVLLPYAGQLGPHHDVAALLEHVERRGPLRRRLTLLPTPRAG